MPYGTFSCFLAVYSIEWMRAASFDELYLELNAAKVDNLYRDNYAHALWASKQVFDVSLHIYIHTYIHKYSGFLIVLISVGLAQAQARPNYYGN